MTLRRLLLVLLAAGCALAAALPAAASARFSYKKGIWGPETPAAFSTYHDLGAGVYLTAVKWSDVAPTRPAHPRSSRDRAYQWPKSLTEAVALARPRHMRVAVQIWGAPRWANGGHSWNWAPKRPKDFADFAYAISKRYPSVHLWMIWGEPSRRANFRPETPEHRHRSASKAPAHMGAAQKRAPHLYARILDASYVALHQANKANKVIGGDTFTTGDISPYNWIRNLRLPSGRPPRMDMYGHNPFTERAPSLAKPPSGYGWADYSDLDTLVRWIDKYLTGRRSGPKHLKLFLAEFTAPTDHLGQEFDFWVDRKTQARWIRDALRIARRWNRVYMMGWISLQDDSLSNKGLIDSSGRKKPGYFAFKRG
jgi:hypothetical protein